ncbi:MAG: hypothetical protein HUU02_13655 [Bacteroidetes bacterium]|nr:hypothetical protein [Bacteroidota bacterium]
MTGQRLSDAFSTIFSDQEWFNKVLVGGFYFLLIPFGIGIVMLNGFLEEFVAGVRNGATEMPQWRNSGTILRKGIRKSAFALMVLATVYILFFIGTIILTAVSAILILALFLTINTFQIIRSFRPLPLLVSYVLLTVAIAIGWMWIVVGWPLLIFLMMLVQAHLFTSR